MGPCFDYLKNGEVDYVVCDSTVAEARLVAQPGEFEIAWQDTELPEVFAIAVAKDNTELADAMNAALKELKEEGLFEDLKNKWFGGNDDAAETPDAPEATAPEATAPEASDDEEGSEPASGEPGTEDETEPEGETEAATAE